MFVVANDGLARSFEEARGQGGGPVETATRVVAGRLAKVVWVGLRDDSAANKFAWTTGLPSMS